MKASVIVIDYKRKKYILDALQSIKNQKGIDLNDIEVIVVKYYQDEKIDNYIKENFPNYKIINLDPDDPDHYIGRTFSEGIKAASNNLIFLLEDDDMFTENKISRIFEVVEKIKDYDEYAIFNKFIAFYDEKGKSFKKQKSTETNNSSIILNIKDKDKLIDYLKNIYYVVDRGLLCYFNKNKKIIRINEPLTYYRRHKENMTGKRYNRHVLEMFLQDLQYIYEKTKCKGEIYEIISYKIALNIMYNANYKISLKEYLEVLSIFDRDFIRRLTKIILYKLFKNYLRKYYLKKFIFTDLNTQNV
ncbi:MAG: glycosyltransferase family 2 protein [Candidatus Nanopusillus sp.]